MKTLPTRPFLTQDFSSRGGGIDFLGLRWVNLNMVGRYLIPEINNVTTDMGTFLIAGWVVWKFRQLCAGQREYTEANFRSFREKVETALSLTFREDSGLERPNGVVRNRVGITHECPLPGILNFQQAKRDSRNSLYAPAIYGPSLRALGLISAYRCETQDATQLLNIPVTPDNPDAANLFDAVDAVLSESDCYDKLGSLGEDVFEENDIHDLARHGLDPCFYRSSEHRHIWSAFAQRLLPSDSSAPGYGRTLTTRLILHTLELTGPISVGELRNSWYTGLLRSDSSLAVPNEELNSHRRKWACFMARQYQRYYIELFLCCFERALNAGHNSIEKAVDYWRTLDAGKAKAFDYTFLEFLHFAAGDHDDPDERTTSTTWNRLVDATHKDFEYTPNADATKQPVWCGFLMLAHWYWRMLTRIEDEDTRELMKLGGSDRMSITWFMNWLTARKSLTLQQLLHDIFSDLIFSQHMRIALSRFDGTTQRLRFLLGDNGIEPTNSARSSLGKLDLPWMPDRLEALIALLSDCGILTQDATKIGIGPDAAAFAPDLIADLSATKR